MVAGMDPAWSGGGGVDLPALMPSYVGHVHLPPIDLQVKSCLTIVFEL
jgi:hypothetical protein